MIVRIADITIQICLGRHDQEDATKQLLGGFVVRANGHPADAQIHVVDHLPDELPSHHFHARPDLCGWFSHDRTQAIVQPPAPEGTARAVERSLRILMADLLPGRNGLLLHASAAIGSSGGVLFAGPSGAGKSTIIARFPHDRVLSDDTVAVRFEGSRAIVYATPFVNASAHMPSPASAPAMGILILSRGSSTRIVPMSKLDRYRSVLQSTLMGVPIPSRDPMLHWVSAFVDRVPVARLERPVDGDVSHLLAGSWSSAVCP